MTPHHVLSLARSALRSGRYLLDGSVQFPRARLGDVLELPTGDAFIVYRETDLVRGVDDSEARVVLVFGMDVEGRDVSETVRGVLFDPLANVATPFFAGMPGFRRKLWLAGTRQGEFLELYEWATRADADRFVDTLASLLAPFDFAGDAWFEVVDDDTIDDFVDAHAIDWRDGSPPPRHRPSRVRPVAVGLVGLVAVGYGYLAWKQRSGQGDRPVPVDIEVEGT